MPEYLAPGVYVEETSFRAKSIEGVATSTAGFVGQARFGPTTGAPMLVTSFEEFQRYFGDSADLVLADGLRINHLAHGVRLFFENGGKRVYVSRVYNPPAGQTAAQARAVSPALAVSGTDRFIRARYPGRAGNVVVRVQAIRSGNLLTGAPPNRSLAGVRPGDLVESNNAGAKEREVTAAGAQAVDAAALWAVSLDATGRPVLTGSGGTLDLNTAALRSVQKITLNIVVEPNGDGSTGDRSDSYGGLSPHPDSDVFIGRVLRQEDPVNGVEPPADRTNRIYADLGALPTTAATRAGFAGGLLTALVTGSPVRLTGGVDGRTVDAAGYTGSGAGHDASGLVAMEAIEDVAIVAAPGGAALAEPDRLMVRNALISHAERMRYRFAILAGPQDADAAAIRAARGQHDSTYAALYYPWLVVPRPSGVTGETMLLSPEGAMAGIYARSDIERGVHKAPANEVVRGILRFSRPVNKGEQDVLNPEGINCLRFFEGRGQRVWGARTISSDPEWMYVNVRRLFIFLEHSIDRGTQWAVFEPNNEALWLRIRLTIESFLTDVWRTGALMGTKPEEAYFVRCDRTTMTQSDLDNGRLVCLIGVAPTKPAEYVIFRIGQWTADASLV
ncbi:phage tail sheath family protein [Falsiroseomonas oryzae]|uniref:phage tail sheath family protein n=1 Tax=Falsiroseomonas oryzae TaxID=2766473 RepID=UPI0022EB95A2|nr:phage tail sheath subtilisin-like domain-containing protein [Roseomonas sp. MO-31]